MGTNYYLMAPDPCPCCGERPDGYPLHIGKSSVGWCFALHVIPEAGINNLYDWIPLFIKRGIEDECGEEIPLPRMLSVIQERSFDRYWFHPAYRDEADFHEKNNSEPGPNRLLRHRIGGNCVGHGEGTWDYIVGYFR